ncbi:MAG: hypothetical protein AAB605_03560 [Patescibacteria group bacterium]
MESTYVMLMVSVPLEHADAVRRAMGDAGAGILGDYSHCSFSYSGTGRFVPGESAHPAYGKPGELASVAEERIEMLCSRAKLASIIAAMKRVHPYEKPAFHYFPVEIE